ncbi:hypothetical protein N658DRAFT_510810 [Parathielavia hyrcaniae]|uniref:Uncharacterized protein n=1 Tax=Parathielavia hyrcaniae TaxID=113614 RepID=A0AAN6SXY0_9PEZI|nr:hypothetical protein N658DRAFT_510810 [Parathielavia hyrcaniae]
MSGFEIVGVIVSAVPIVAKVIKHFGTQRNAPRQVERLSRILAELQDDRLQRFAKPEEQKIIHDMVNRCTDILERETGSQKGRVWKFFWSADAERLLKEHNDELEHELERILRRMHMFAVLYLQNPYGQRIGEKLKLKTLTILERDDTWRRIQYVGRGPGGVEIRITHRIPRGNIWFEDEDMEDRSVSFLEPHDITVQNAEGYKVYRAYSLYEFGTVEHRELFLVSVRERELLGRYCADKIWEKGELIAQQKVVRLWKKKASDMSQKTTLAFIGRDEKPYERPLVDFRRSPALRADRVELVDVVRGTNTTFEFRPPPKGQQGKAPKAKWKFGSSKSKGSAPPTPDAGAVESDAALFKAAFEASHPSTSTWNPQALPLSPTGFEPADFKAFAPARASTPSPCLPDLVPSSSRAPTLSTLSIPSADFSFFQDRTFRLASPTEKD